MLRQWTILTLFVVTFVVCCLLSADVYVTRQVKSFQKELRTEWPKNHLKLMQDAGVARTRTVLPFLDPIPAPTIQLDPPTLIDRMQMRRKCKVHFQTHYKGTDGIALLKNMSEYSIGIFGTEFLSTQEDLSWAQVK